MIKRDADPDLGLLLIRVGLAVVFIAHGWQKFAAMDKTIGFFGTLGFGAFFAYLVAAIELLGGIAMLVGIGTHYAGLALAAVMVAAIYLVKYNKGFLGGYEFDLTLLLAALGITLTGPGAQTIERWTKRK